MILITRVCLSIPSPMKDLCGNGFMVWKSAKVSWVEHLATTGGSVINRFTSRTSLQNEAGSTEVNVDIPRTSHVWHLIPILDFPLIMFGYVWSIVSDSHWQRSEFTSAPTWKPMEHSWEHSDANTHILQALWAFWSSLKQTAKHDANTEVVSINTSPESVY